ncbi:hypothetical protein V1264_007319 [Littorina saxatilis]|uniref:MACPF domain-containing protein n=2 Tax=Littorina saxatilis TaxID=31220 RepID=A0AAN9AUZ8_9CAEN
MKENFHHVCILIAVFGIMVHEARGCTNVVPGLDRMTRGIDITTFDLYDKDNRGLRQAIVEFNCDRGKNKTIDGTLYAIPDEVNSVTTVPGAISNAVTRVVRTYNESRDVLAQNFQIGGTVKKFGFSLSQSLRQTQEAIYKESRYVSTVSAFESAREAQLQTVYDLEISPNAKKYMENYLVADRNPKNEDFSRFIRDYGTHYFQAANFGGILLVELQTKTSYYREHGEEALKVQAEAQYLNVVKTSTGVEIGKDVVDEEFTKLTTTSTR